MRIKVLFLVGRETDMAKSNAKKPLHRLFLTQEKSWWKH